MAITIGDRLPAVDVRTMTGEGPRAMPLPDPFAMQRGVLFAVPGAFTPTCSAKHLPGYIDRAQALREKGIDVVACLSVNDPFVMSAWARVANAGDAVLMLADGNGDAVRAMGLDVNMNAVGFGMRSKRFAMVLDDAVVTQLYVEEPGGFGISGADHVLANL